jgi:hypothetical protein
VNWRLRASSEERSSGADALALVIDDDGGGVGAVIAELDFLVAQIGGSFVTSRGEAEGVVFFDLPAGLGVDYPTKSSPELPEFIQLTARTTGLEPATTGSTVRYSNQLSYVPKVLRLLVLRNFMASHVFPHDTRYDTLTLSPNAYVRKKWPTR